MARTREANRRRETSPPGFRLKVTEARAPQPRASEAVVSAPSRRRGRSGRRGSVLVLTAISMVVMVAMVAFAVDTGYILHVRTDLQRTADACALAGAAEVPNETEARRVVREVAAENGWDFTSWGLDGLEVACGYWDRDAATFTSPAPSGKPTNSVRVTVKRLEATGNPVKLFFGSFFGTSQTDVTASATAMRDRWLCGPFVGIDYVSVPGSPETDSYNSDNGWYVFSDGQRGSLCSDGPINVDGAAIVRGDAQSGKHFDVSITGGAQVTGAIGQRKRPLNLPPVDASEAAVTNDNDQIPLIPEGNSFRSPVDGNGNFLLDGSRRVDMPPGTYYFNDFTLAGSSVFNATGPGPTTIYVTGNLYRGGQVLLTNTTGQPSNLKIYMTGGTAEVTSGNDFHGVIYAPNTDVTIDGSSDLFGAVVGRTLTITGSGFAHYDEALDLEEVELPTRTALVD